MSEASGAEITSRAIWERFVAEYLERRDPIELLSYGECEWPSDRETRSDWQRPPSCERPVSCERPTKAGGHLDPADRSPNPGNRNPIQYGEQGVEFGEQGVEFGKQSVEFRKQGVELGRPGAEFERQGVEFRIRFGGDEGCIRGAGNGPIDAFVDALDRGIGQPVRIVDFSEHAIGAGADAEAVAYVEIDAGGERTLFGVGRHANSTTACLAAVVAAANRLRADRTIPTA
jgi:hypothetical protein